MIGRVFDDRYEVIRKLGSGGMADVFLAEDRLLGRQVALKVLFDRYANDEQFVERFRREASSAASLNHPNIVQIYDRGQAEGTYYIAMEYLEGRSLKEIILKYAPLGTDLVVSVSTQIVEALRFAHRRDVIHRDIKPQNIIVDNEGRVKVTDFGIARAGNASTMTEAGSILGTAHYLSPEQAQGQSVEAASDLYSLGVVMYEMVTGKLPFNGDNPVSIAMQHVHEMPAPPRSIVPDCPENLQAVILRALAKHPIERYLTAQAMLDDLGRVQDGEPVSIPASYIEETTRIMTPAAAAAAASMSNGQTTTIRRRVTDQLQPMIDPYEEPRRPSVWPWILVIVLILALGGAAYAIFSNWGNAGSNLLVVPGVANMSQSDAKQTIENAGFKFDPQQQPSATVQAGVVIRQTPDGGTKANKGDKITVYISSGKGTVSVPNLVGKSKASAFYELGKLGLTPNEQDEAATSDDQVGNVIRQSPDPNTSLQVGDKVTFVIAGPTEAISVPRVIGMSQEAAQNDLTSMNLQFNVEEVSSTSPGGTVTDQNPKEGEKVQKNATITIYVSNAPAVTTVKVPAVGGIGMTLGEALARLQLFELIGEEEPYYVDNPKAGIVLQQDPAAGTPVERGSTVKLYVSAEPTTTTTTEPPSTDTTESPTSTDTTYTTDF